jgi:predicted nuclease of predicted toxin-antitoxin system
VATFKLDENVPIAAADRLRTAGHDVHTVQAEGLAGSSDEQLAHQASREGRTLLTLDKDFTDIRRHPPEESPGIIVLRPQVPSPSALAALLEQLLPLFESEPLQGHLWVVDQHRVRIWPGEHGPALPE